MEKWCTHIWLRIPEGRFIRLNDTHFFTDEHIDDI